MPQVHTTQQTPQPPVWEECTTKKDKSPRADPGLALSCPSTNWGASGYPVLIYAVPTPTPGPTVGFEALS